MKKWSAFVEVMKLKFRKFYIKKTSANRKKKIRNYGFTIISNNCWGGFIYQSYALKYNTPTIGLFFMADDYIRFISNLKHYINFDEIKFIESKNSKYYDKIKEKDNFGKYPIGRIDDIEIHFLHYHTNEEALKKWNERKKRINYDCILYKFSDMNFCTEKDIKNFINLGYKNKICFVSKKYKNFKNDYIFVVRKDSLQVKASDEPFGNSKIVNINQIINEL